MYKHANPNYCPPTPQISWPQQLTEMGQGPIMGGMTANAAKKKRSYKKSGEPRKKGVRDRWQEFFESIPDGLDLAEVQKEMLNKAMLVSSDGYIKRIAENHGYKIAPRKESSKQILKEVREAKSKIPDFLNAHHKWRYFFKRVPKKLTLTQLTKEYAKRFAASPAPEYILQQAKKFNYRLSHDIEAFFKDLPENLELNEVRDRMRGQGIPTTKNKTKSYCEQFGYQLKAVQKKRKTREQLINSKSNIYDWSNVDWTMPNALICLQVGCTRQAVSEKRKTLGYSPGRDRVRSKMLVRRKYAHMVRKKAFERMVEIYGKSVFLILTYKEARDVCDLPLARTKSDLFQFCFDRRILFVKRTDLDWRLSNIDLVEIWNAPSATVAWARVRSSKTQPLKDGRNFKRMSDSEYKSIYDEHRLYAQKRMEQIEKAFALRRRMLLRARRLYIEMIDQVIQERKPKCRPVWKMTVEMDKKRKPFSYLLENISEEVFNLRSLDDCKQISEALAN